MSHKRYIGRFAPTPSGDLHFGSLLSALASYLDAKSQHGIWKLRIDDVDTPRIVSGSTDAILSTLERHGLHWDDTEVYQSQRFALYADALQQLLACEVAFPCDLSRKELFSHYNGIHPGKAHSRLANLPTTIWQQKPHCIRANITTATVHFTDRWQGGCEYDLHQTLGAFTLFRRDDIYAYHLATVVDDHMMNITHVVRGKDLLSSTPAHHFLHEALYGENTITYAHHHLLLNPQQQKLSKQHHAQKIPMDNPLKNLHRALIYLNQSPPALCEFNAVSDILQWGIAHWNTQALIHAPSQTMDE